MNIQKITTFTFLLASVFIIIGLSACDRVTEVVQPEPPQMAESEKEISVGIVLSLTGRFTESFGIHLSQGFELARTELNAPHRKGPKLKFIIEDDQSTIEGAVAAFSKLIHEDGVSVILGPATSAQTEAAFAVAQQNHVVAIGPVSAARGLSAIGDYVFRVSLTTDALIPHGIQVTQAKMGYQRVATIYDETDLFSVDGENATQDALAANGVSVLTAETFQGGDTDFTAQLTHIQALMPEAVFVSALPASRVAILAQKHELGLTAPFFIRTLTGLDIEMIGEAAEGAIGFVGWSSIDDAPGNQAFVQRYTAEYGVTPNNYAAGAYGAVHILANALSRAEATDAAAIRDALAHTEDLETIFGAFTFDADGDAVYTPKILIVTDGEFRSFE